MPKGSAPRDLRPLLIGALIGIAVNLLTAETDGWWAPLQPITRQPWIWIPPLLVVWAAWEWCRARTPRATWKAGNPYPGLAPFDADRAQVFFGRESETTALFERLERAGRLAHQRSIAVVGPSGSGKSSLLQAGLVPRLGGNWHVLGPMIPGIDPFISLAKTLGNADETALADRLRQLAADETPTVRELAAVLSHGQRRNTVLLVDQTEDLFTPESRADAHSFLRLITRIVSEHRSVRLVMALRPEYLREASVLAPSIFSHPEAIGPLEPRRVREAIVRPAEAAGVIFEDGLVDDMVAEATVGDALPLLGLLLQRLFRTAEHGVVRHDAYENAGRVHGAIAEQADEVYAHLGLGTVVENTLIRFVGYENDEPVRKRVSWSDLSELETQVVDEFRKARLVVDVNDGQEVQLAHDAVFRQWDRLSDMVARNKLRLQRMSQLEYRAAEWSRTGNEHDLLRGETLRTAEDGATVLSCSPKLEKFLASSRKVENDYLSGQADKTAKAAQEIFASDPETAVCVAAATVREIFPSTTARLTLWGFTTSPSRSRFVVSHGQHITSGVRLPSGFILTADRDGQVCTWNPDGELVGVRRLPLNSTKRTSSLNPAGTYLAVVSDEGPVTIYAVTDFEKMSASDSDEPVSEIRWITDDLLVAFSRASLRIWRVEEGQLRQMAQLPTSRDITVEWSTDARSFAIIERRQVAIWNIVEAGTAELTAVVREPLIKSFLWSPSNDRLLIVGRSVGVQSWEVSLRDRDGGMVEHWRTPQLSSVLWSTDGKYLHEIVDGSPGLYRDGRTGLPATPELASGSSFALTEGTRGLTRDHPWPAPESWTGSPFPPSGEVDTVSWDPLGIRAAAASRSGPPCIISRTSPPIFLQNNPRPSLHSQRGAVTWSPDGNWIAGIDGTKIVLWDASTGTREGILGADAEFGSMSWSPDSTRIAAARRGHPGYRRRPTILIAEVNSGKIVQELNPLGTLQGLVAWSPDGESIAAVDSYGITLFSVSKETETRRWETANTTIKSLSWSSDSKRLAARSAEAVSIFDTTTGTRKEKTGRAVSRVCFHRQQPWIACWYKDGVMEIWERDLMQRIAIITAPSDCDVRSLTWNEHLTAITRDGTILTWHMPPAGQDHSEVATRVDLSSTQRAAFGLPPDPTQA